MKKLTIIAATAGLALCAATSQGQIVLAGGSTLGLTPLTSLVTNPYGPVGTSGGVLGGNYSSQVFETGTGTLDFLYQVQQTGDDSAAAFSVGGYAGVSILGIYDIAATGTTTATGGSYSVLGSSLTIAPTAGITGGASWDEVLVVTGAKGYGVRTAGVLDSGGANTVAFAPAPVPEASTVMAGALMLLPLGIGAVRAIRKERTV